MALNDIFSSTIFMLLTDFLGISSNKLNDIPVLWFVTWYFVIFSFLLLLISSFISEYILDFFSISSYVRWTSVSLSDSSSDISFSSQFGCKWFKLVFCFNYFFFLLYVISQILSWMHWQVIYVLPYTNENNVKYILFPCSDFDYLI